MHALASQASGPEPHTSIQLAECTECGEAFSVSHNYHGTNPLCPDCRGAGTGWRGRLVCDSEDDSEDDTSTEEEQWDSGSESSHGWFASGSSDGEMWRRGASVQQIEALPTRTVRAGDQVSLRLWAQAAVRGVGGCRQRPPA